MAAPVVAGMAALVRTRFDDKSIYSSRFVMGQLGSTGFNKQGLPGATLVSRCIFFTAYIICSEQCTKSITLLFRALSI